MSLVLAIDQSTSATKALLFDAAGRVIHRASREHRQLYPQPGWCEHDAQEIWDNTLAAAGEVIALAGHAAGEIGCVSLSNQRETFVVFDRATGRPICPAVVWQCRRGVEVCERLTREGHARLIEDKTGLRIDTYFTAPKAARLMSDHPPIARALHDGSAALGTIDSYLIHRLTGGKVFATDTTNASRTLLLDISTMKWGADLCGVFGVPMSALPEVRDSTANFGMTDFAGLLGRSVPIVGVMGDSQASLFAHRCFSPGAAKVTLGTGSSLLLNLGGQYQPREAREGGAVTTIAWSHAGRPTYSREGIINFAAATVAWLKDQLRLIADPAETETLARSVADNGGVYLVPAFAGLGAPHWSASARAAIVGLSSQSTRAHVARAALESIAYQVRDALGSMTGSSAGGGRVVSIRADGGATRNTFLMQFIADITGVTVEAARSPDCSPLGAAMAGMVGSGMVGSIEALASLPQESTRYSPLMPADQAAQLCSGWARAVRQVLAGVS